MIAMVIVFLNMASALSVVTNASIFPSYQAGDVIHGKITLSLRDEPASSLFQSNFAGNITLIELLAANDAQQNVDYNCSTRTCESTYSARESISSVNLAENDYPFGFAIRGREVAIQTLDILLTSGQGASCGRQLEVIIPETNESLYNTNLISNPQLCETSHTGCFDTSLAGERYKEAVLSSENYCNKILLEPAPGYYIGANVRVVQNSSLMTMRFFDSSLEEIGNCRLPIPAVGSSTLGCIINKSIVVREDFFVCISSGVPSDYRIRYEEEGAICGGAGIGETTSEDYDVFARPLPYGPLANMSVSRAYSSTYDVPLAERANDYISRVYGGDCNTTCVIPFVLRGGTQLLQLNNASITWTSRGATRVDNTLYRLERIEPLITSNRPLALEVSYGHFIADTAAERFLLRLGSTSLLGLGIPVQISEAVAFDVVPRTVPLGIETGFIIVGPANVSRVVWKFGEGTTKTTTGRTASFRYTNASTYTLEVAITLPDGRTATKRFEIIVGNASESATALLARATAAHANITAYIASLEPPLQRYLNERLNMTATAAQLNNIRRDYTLAANESMHASVVQRILALSLPSSIAVTKSGALPFAAGFSRIDTSYVEELANVSVPEEQQTILRDSLLDWNEKQYNPRVEFKVIAAVDSAAAMPLATYFRIIPNKTGDSSQPAWLIIDRPQSDLIINSGTGAQSILSDAHSGTSIPLQNNQIIEIVVPGETTFAELGAFIAPPLDTLGKYGEQRKYLAQGIPKGRLALWIALLIAGIFVLYIILQESYKRHYEQYLFKNRDDLYNLIHFIYNSRRSGMNDDVIRSKLRENEWKGEQITYAFKKIDGKRTGMLEIPIFSLFERRTVRAELEKRMHSPIDARFIKRP